MMTKIVRKSNKATGGITPAEKAAMAEVAQEWIGIAMRTAPIEPDKIVPAIERLYAAADLPRPRVVIAPSPLVMAFAYGAAAAIWHGRATQAATQAATGEATWAATQEATRKATGKATDPATWAATRKATWEATRAATGAATHAATEACRAIAGAPGIECAKRWTNVLQGGNMWTAWCSYIAATRDVLSLRLPEHVKYQAWEDAARHGGFRVLHEKFCIVSDFPELIRVDDQRRPHCETGPSHRWRDGWSLYHWHGTRIPAEWIEDRASLTAQIALTWKNIEQRRAACEILGWQNILTALDARTIDRDDDPEIGELVEVTLPGIGRERFLRVLCGTGREFALPVPPDMQTALQAQAWTWALDDRDFTKPEVRT